MKMNKMQVISYRKHTGAVIFILVWRLSFVIAQPGFLSIDCGGKQNRTDPTTNITWVTDDNYIGDRGVKVEINDSASLPFYLQTVRVFPAPLNKSCYKLPLIPDVPQLLRPWFFVGTINGLQRIPLFDFSIETIDMLFVMHVSLQRAQRPVSAERILLTAGEVGYLCLIRNSEKDDLFLSAIELRTLEKGMYDVVKPGLLLRRLQRYDMGAQSNDLIRYPQDRFDRLWDLKSVKGAQNVTSVETISTNNTRNLVPAVVMETAATGKDCMYFPLAQSPIPQMTTSYLLVLYFAEIEALNGSESRSFLLLINNETRLADVSLGGNSSAKTMVFPSETPLFDFTLQKAFHSSRGPLINAFEYFQLFVTKPATSSIDVEALAAVKQKFNIENWVSDPCFVFPWEGIQCTNANSTVRVSEINLSGKRLKTSVPPSFAQLTDLIHLSLDNNHLTGALPNLSDLSKLQTLHLQNNSLSGSVPDWLFQLQNLRELFIENNNFSGVIPRQLLNRPTLQIRYSGNHYLCMNKGDCDLPSHSNRRKPKIILGSLLACGIVLAFLLSIIVCRKNHKRRRRSVKILGQSTVLVPNSSKSHAFTSDEMLTATKDFRHKIGQGGFGSVFWGELPGGNQIAVKVLSLFSKQGAAQFLNEIELLSRVHHKNLVSLLGYCSESRDLMLVYQFMSGGSLNDRLYGSNAFKYPNLDWRTRLKIALDAAQGLEYLHVGCTPKIIHRDVKTANILLDSNLNGKLADFGLSKVAMDEDASQVFTAVRGTVGYLDPKYLTTHMLTEKSDVYSFGVVLLEIICGRRPIDTTLSEEKLSLIKWVTPFVEQGEDSVKITEIVDERLHNNYELKSICHVAKLAMRCIADEPSWRPSISEVVVEMKAALHLEKEKDAATVNNIFQENNVESLNRSWGSVEE